MMKRSLTIFLLTMGMLCALAQVDARAQMAVMSPDFADGGTIPAQFTGDGANRPPVLMITGVPAGAKSLAIVVDDPDAPSGTFTHWIVWNIAPTTGKIGGGALPAGMRQGVNDFGENGYTGPTPPSGTHHYHFRVKALDTILSLGTNATRSDFDAATNGHILAAAEVMGKYSRGR
jgi:Raf kinase inhibitor-like YbhB/YbcL family protein